ncbi:hypothetical protein HDU77_006148, partial [Chytriomyces hyalinus]
MMTEHTHPLWGMPLNSVEVQFVADDIENDHHMDKNRVGAEIATPLTTERLISLKGEAASHTDITGYGFAVEEETANQQRDTSITSPIAINYHSPKKSNPQKPTTAPEPDVGPTGMAWIHDKTRSLVRKSFGQVLRTILDDFSVEGITPGLVHVEETCVEGTAPPEWLHVTELAGTMEDALFDLTSDGVE